MNPPGRDVSRAQLESLCAHARIALALVDQSGGIVWASRFAHEMFPGAFVQGRTFDSALQGCTVPESESLQATTFAQNATEGNLRRSTVPGSEGTIYRYYRLPLEEAGPGFSLHYLLNISEEQKLKQHFVHNLQQLKSMKEIVDVLYESLGTQEVIYLILVAVTSQIGFGFNRAFLLNVKGNRLRGRIGIGPSNHEEAHQIWTRIASLNFSSLREVYNDLTRNGDVPDPRTQEIALRMDFDLTQLGGTFDLPRADLAPFVGQLPGLLGAIQRGKPARINASEPGTSIDRALFSLLTTDAVAVVPLYVRGRLAGVITADNFINRKPITEADLNVLKTFAGYAGVALERSQLYDELRESIAKLQDANESLKANQQKLLQAEKLSAIGELAAYVSHEIRNPLVAIGGLARSLLTDQIDNADTAETLEIIVSEVNRLEKFLRDTLDFVKPRVTKPASVDINDLVRDCLVTFKNELSTSSIQVEQDVWSSPLRCLVDPELLRHALSNLIKNAIEALSAGGRIFLGTRREGSSAVIRVGDTGIGIPPEALPRIFEPFFTTKPRGTGLGLSLAFQNMRSIGGQLELEQHPTFKTVFKVTVPLQDLVPRTATREERMEMTLSGGSHENRPRSR